jgi:GAF domain-containing protein
MPFPSFHQSYRSALDDARSLEGIGRVVKTAARQLTGAQGATFVLAQDGYCFYADEDAIGPLWKGQRFPMDHCISGWAMVHGVHAVVPDITCDARIPLTAYAPTFVRSLAMVPVGEPAVAAIGAYWATEHEATLEEVHVLQNLASATAAAIERVGLDEAPWAPNFSLA